MPYRKTLPRSLDSMEDLRELVELFVSSEQIQGATAYAVELAVEELFTNLVRHNRTPYPTIEVELARSGDRIRLFLEDRDVDQFDPTTLPVVDTGASAEERQPGGLGVHLVQSAFDDLQYQYADRVLTVTATRRIGSSVRNPTE